MSLQKPRAYSVNDFLSWQSRQELVLQPKFQRRDVWSTPAKSHLIDTILRGLPVPIIFIRQDIDPDLRRTIREVVDGQQRLQSIISYANDDFAVIKSHNPHFGGKVFSQLPAEAKQGFLNYEFSVVLLEGADDATVLDIFARLNTYGQKLTSQELLNAAYYGEFKQTVYALGLEHLEFWRTNKILSDREIVRMAEADLTTELLVTMLFGVQHRRSRIDQTYEDLDEVFPEKKKCMTQFRSTVDAIRDSFGDTLKDSIYCKRILFYSVFCAFYHLLYGISDTDGLARSPKIRKVTGSGSQKVRDSLQRLQDEYRTTPPPEKIAKFFEACRGGTGDKDQRIVRIETILKRMLASL